VKKRLRLLTSVLAALLAVYVAVTFVQVWTASHWEDTRPTQAIVVMGAAQYNGTPSPVLQGRLDRALELYEAGVADVVVVTGGSQVGDITTEAATGYVYLRDRGVPDDALRLEVDGTSTWESLAATERFLNQDAIDEVVIVSDPYHSLRLVATANDVGLEARVAPTRQRTTFSLLVRETVAVSAGRLIGFRRL
jgi:vancomycin permeability regulator SanA